MSTFPTLKTGAVMQYPAQRALEFSTATVQFVDGSEQRFRNYQAPLHRWVIQLSLLDESERHQFEEFFRAIAGQAGSFSFTDPWDGTNYSSCSVANDDMTTVLSSEWNAQTSLTVRENRS